MWQNFLYLLPIELTQNVLNCKGHTMSIEEEFVKEFEDYIIPTKTIEKIIEFIEQKCRERAIQELEDVFKLSLDCNTDSEFGNKVNEYCERIETLKKECL